MSAEEPVTEETTLDISLEELKIDLAIRGDSNIHDDKLRSIIEDAKAHVHATLQAYSDIPIASGDMVYVTAKMACKHYCRMMWYEFQWDIPKSTYNKEVFNEKIESVISMLNALRNERTRTVITSADPRKEKLIIPAQLDTLIYSEY